MWPDTKQKSKKYGNLNGLPNFEHLLLPEFEKTKVKFFVSKKYAFLENLLETSFFRTLATAPYDRIHIYT